MPSESQLNRIRLGQRISHLGYCSRRAADRLIAQGEVKVNGQVAVLGQKVTEKDVILISDKTLPNKRSQPWFILYHKPVGIVCSNAKTVANNLPTALKKSGFVCNEHWFAVGRLDKDSEGILLLTNYSEAAHALLHYQSQKNKEYIVTVDAKVSMEAIEVLRSGVKIGQTMTRPCDVFRLAEQVLMFRLVEGRHRQIRRMCQSVGLRVVRLQRISFAGLNVAGLAVGDFRKLATHEVEALKSVMGVIQ